MNSKTTFRRIIILFVLVMGGNTILFSQGGEGTYHKMQINTDDTVREYTLYVPNGYNGTDKLPLVFLFHGYDAPVITQIDVSQMYLVADTAMFFVVYPQGLPVEDLVFGGAAPGWNIPVSYDGEQDDVAFTDQILDELISNSNYVIDTNRIHATGWSNGGEMTFFVACHLSHRIASVAAVSGVLSYPVQESYCSPARKISTMHFQGTEDIFAPVDGDSLFPPLNEVSKMWAMNSNCDTIPTETELEDKVTTDSSTVTLLDFENCDDNFEVKTYRIENGGHCWPGGWLPEEWAAWLGHINMDIHASVEMWEFFKRNPHPDQALTISEVKMIDGVSVYPNPFSHTVAISYNLDSDAEILFTVVDQMGKQLYVFEEKQQDGVNRINWEPNDLPQGIYFYRLMADTQVISGKLLLR